MRKIDDTYYFIYSSRHNHELCYATSSSPTGEFTFQRTLISIADIGINGIDDEQRANNFVGNTHGSLLELDDKFYIFYHRQTNTSSYARQACAQRIEYSNGKFKQAELTSCGLSPIPLPATSTYPAYIACNLWGKNHRTGRYDTSEKGELRRLCPYITQESNNNHQYIANMRDGSVIGFKYFNADSFADIESIGVKIRKNDRRHSEFQGKIILAVSQSFETDSIIGTIELSELPKDWHTYDIVSDKLQLDKTISHYKQLYNNTDIDCVPLYAIYAGEGTIECDSVCFD